MLQIFACKLANQRTPLYANIAHKMVANQRTPLYANISHKMAAIWTKLKAASRQNKAISNSSFEITLEKLLNSQEFDVRIIKNIYFDA